LGGCQKSKITCEITSPKDGAEISIHKDLIVEINATDTKNSVAAVTVYLNNLPYPCTMIAPYTCTIPSILLELGKQTVKAVTINNLGDQAEATISITIVKDGGNDDEESPNFVNFADGIIPPSWKTSTWAIENTIGYDDNYSLKSSTLDISSVLTYKTINASGYVEFYTRGDNFDLYINGIKAAPFISEPSVVPNWKRWVYSLNKGRHSFRWETTG
jgi:hypothetical protein